MGRPIKITPQVQRWLDTCTEVFGKGKFCYATKWELEFQFRLALTEKAIKSVVKEKGISEKEARQICKAQYEQVTEYFDGHRGKEKLEELVGIIYTYSQAYCEMICKESD
jgi:hypothetical protein